MYTEPETDITSRPITKEAARHVVSNTEEEEEVEGKNWLHTDLRPIW